MHLEDEYDYRFNPKKEDHRDKLFDLLKACYYDLNKEILPVYAVTGDIDVWETTKEMYKKKE